MPTRSQRHVYAIQGTVNGLYPPSGGPSPPTITSPSQRTVQENSAFSLALTATTAVTWSKAGGSDQGLFTLTGATLSMPAKNYEAPADADGDNVYVIVLRATDTVSGLTTVQTFSLTVSDVVEDLTPPTINTAGSVNLAENQALSLALTADEAVTWSKVGGADQALFTISGSNLTLPAQNFESPADADLGNTYVVIIRATDAASNTTDKTITVTVTDVDETFFTDFTALADQDLSAVAGWSRIIGVANGAAVRSGRLAGLDTGAPGSLYLITDQGSGNQWVEYKVSNPLPASSGPFAICRSDLTGQNYVGIRTIGSSIELYRRESSNMNALWTSSSGLIAAGDVLRLEVNGPNWTVKRNGAQQNTGLVGGALPVTGRQGFIARSVVVNPFADNFRAGTL